MELKVKIAVAQMEPTILGKQQSIEGCLQLIRVTKMYRTN